MYGRQGDSGDDDSQVPPWLVRAEVTIRHGNAVTSETVRLPPGTTTTADAAGIRMICRWNTSEADSSAAPTATPTSMPAPAPSNVVSSPLGGGGGAGGFGFQRGNILFTSTPPERPSQRPLAGSYTLPRSGSSGNDDSISSTRGRANDSGYTSEQFSHPHPAYSSLPSRRPSQQYNRKCKSTCSIVLQQSAAGADAKSPAASPFANSPRSSRTAPSVDFWSHRRQHIVSRYPFSAVPEVCEDCAEGSAASSAFTTHFCTRVAEKSANRTAVTTISKDAASQTTDIESVRSSSTVSKSSRVRRRPATAAGQPDEKKKEEIRSPSASVGTSGSAPPAPPADSEKSDSSTREDSSKRKSRTVHIDVYCTGSDDDLSTDTTSDDERSTPMTVFENEDVRITHTQATNNLPRGFQDENAFLKRSAERRCASFRNAPMRMPSLASSKGYDSDEVLSSLYPSRFSSYTALRDLDSAPWSAASSSTVVSYDSATMTSSKDTDIESLLNNKSVLTPCDSFEYANSTDRDRIRRLDLGSRAADKEKSKSWRSPQIERRQLLRNKKMKEYFEKHEIAWSSADSAEESDESGAVGWSFDRSRLVKKDSATGRTCRKAQVEESNMIDLEATTASRSAAPEEGPRAARAGDHAPHSFLRDRIGPFGSKSPSPLPSTIPSRVTSPFTTPHGERTDHIMKASMFGAVISAFRKPGHHIGPAKNPSCSCEHCRRFFEEEARGRSSSLSELERHPGFKSHKE